MKSNFCNFLKDFGDAIGGAIIGYSAGIQDVSTGVLGSVLVLVSIYIRFYKTK